MQGFNDPYNSWTTGSSEAGQGSLYDQWALGQGSNVGSEEPTSSFGLGADPSLSSPHAAAGGDSTRLYTFLLTNFDPDATNCTVIGPQRRPIAYIVSEPQMPGYTTVRGLDGKGIALIEWQEHPLVEVRGVFSKRRTRDWLALSEDRTSRSMDVSAMRYTWVPDGRHVNLYLSIQTPQMLGRISRSRNSIVLELTTGAMQLGLLDTVLVATLLLQCGRSID